MVLNEGLSPQARHLWFVADKARKPFKGVVIFAQLVQEFGLGEDTMWGCFEELCKAGVVPSAGVSTVIPFEGERPSVGRLKSILWKKLRSLVFERDNFTCRYCGTSDTGLECDHVVPIARGGSNDLDNLATACAACNRSKGAKTIQEWMQ